MRHDLRRQDMKESPLSRPLRRETRRNLWTQICLGLGVASSDW